MIHNLRRILISKLNIQIDFLYDLEKSKVLQIELQTKMHLHRHFYRILDYLGTRQKKNIQTDKMKAVFYCGEMKLSSLT